MKSEQQAARHPGRTPPEAGPRAERSPEPAAQRPARWRGSVTQPPSVAGLELQTMQRSLGNRAVQRMLAGQQPSGHQPPLLIQRYSEKELHNVIRVLYKEDPEAEQGADSEEDARQILEIGEATNMFQVIYEIATSGLVLNPDGFYKTVTGFRTKVGPAKQEKEGAALKSSAGFVRELLYAWKQIKKKRPVQFGTSTPDPLEQALRGVGKELEAEGIAKDETLALGYQWGGDSVVWTTKSGAPKTIQHKVVEGKVLNTVAAELKKAVKQLEGQNKEVAVKGSTRIADLVIMPENELNQKEPQEVLALVQETLAGNTFRQQPLWKFVNLVKITTRTHKLVFTVDTGSGGLALTLEKPDPGVVDEILKTTPQEYAEQAIKRPEGPPVDETQQEEKNKGYLAGLNQKVEDVNKDISGLEKERQEWLQAQPGMSDVYKKVDPDKQVTPEQQGTEKQGGTGKQRGAKKQQKPELETKGRLSRVQELKTELNIWVSQELRKLVERKLGQLPVQPANRDERAKVSRQLSAELRASDGARLEGQWATDNKAKFEELQRLEEEIAAELKRWDTENVPKIEQLTKLLEEKTKREQTVISETERVSLQTAARKSRTDYMNEQFKSLLSIKYQQEYEELSKKGGKQSDVLNPLKEKWATEDETGFDDKIKELKRDWALLNPELAKLISAAEQREREYATGRSKRQKETKQLNQGERELMVKQSLQENPELLGTVAAILEQDLDSASVKLLAENLEHIKRETGHRSAVNRLMKVVQEALARAHGFSLKKQIDLALLKQVVVDLCKKAEYINFLGQLAELNDANRLAEGGAGSAERPIMIGTKQFDADKPTSEGKPQEVDVSYVDEKNVLHLREVALDVETLEMKLVGDKESQRAGYDALILKLKKSQAYADVTMTYAVDRASESELALIFSKIPPKAKGSETQAPRERGAMASYLIAKGFSLVVNGVLYTPERLKELLSEYQSKASPEQDEDEQSVTPPDHGTTKGSLPPDHSTTSGKTTQPNPRAMEQFKQEVEQGLKLVDTLDHLGDVWEHFSRGAADLMQLNPGEVRRLLRWCIEKAFALGGPNEKTVFFIIEHLQRFQGTVSDEMLALALDQALQDLQVGELNVDVLRNLIMIYAELKLASELRKQLQAELSRLVREQRGTNV